MTRARALQVSRKIALELDGARELVEAARASPRSDDSALSQSCPGRGLAERVPGGSPPAALSGFVEQRAGSFLDDPPAADVTAGQEMTDDPLPLPRSGASLEEPLDLSLAQVGHIQSPLESPQILLMAL
jgi:hypothetical protein